MKHFTPSLEWKPCILFTNYQLFQVSPNVNKNKPYLPLWFVKTGTHSSLCCASTVRQLGFVVEDSQHFQILFQFKYFNNLKDKMEIQLRYWFIEFMAVFFNLRLRIFCFHIKFSITNDFKAMVMVMKLIDSGPRARHCRSTASEVHFLDKTAKFLLILKFWANLFK